jgi:hypothetical protein
MATDKEALAVYDTEGDGVFGSTVAVGLGSTGDTETFLGMNTSTDKGLRGDDGLGDGLGSQTFNVMGIAVAVGTAVCCKTPVWKEIVSS